MALSRQSSGVSVWSRSPKSPLSGQLQPHALHKDKSEKTKCHPWWVTRKFYPKVVKLLAFLPINFEADQTITLILGSLQRFLSQRMTESEDSCTKICFNPGCWISCQQISSQRRNKAIGFRSWMFGILPGINHSFICQNLHSHISPAAHPYWFLWMLINSSVAGKPRRDTRLETRAAPVMPVSELSLRVVKSSWSAAQPGNSGPPRFCSMYRNDCLWFLF